MSELSVQRSEVLGADTAQNSETPRQLEEDPKLRKAHTTHREESKSSSYPKDHSVCMRERGRETVSECVMAKNIRPPKLYMPEALAPSTPNYANVKSLIWWKLVFPAQ